MTYPTISALPTPPSRQDPANFADEADAFLGALPTFRTEVNTAVDYIETTTAAVETNATNAATSASEAATSATDAAASATAAALEAAAWVSGASYSEGGVVWSPVDYGTYRAKTTHSGETTDPSSDTTNWALVAANDLPALGLTATATELNYVDGVTSNIQTQLDNISANATLTKSFVSGETSTIALSQAITAGAPVVSVTKEVPQTGVTENAWDVGTTGANYTRHDTAYDTTLTPSSATADGTFTLGTGSFASTDVGKTIEGNGGEAILTATDGSYSLVTAFNDSSTIAAGDWSMYATVFDATNGLELSGLSSIYDIASASYDSVSFSPVSQDLDPRNVIFNANGTKMYILGFNNDTVYQYSLSTAFDVSTASYDSVSFSVSSQESSPYGIAFNNDGTKMYIIGTTNDTVYQYSLSTAFDVSTASYDSVSFSVASEETFPYNLAFNSDGTKMYISGGGSGSVSQYSLSTAFDVSTASYDSVSFSVDSQDDIPTGIAFNSDGTKMYMVGRQNDSVFQYSLSTAFDVSTASYDSVSFSVASEEANTYGLDFSSDGTKMYIIGTDNKSVYQYTTQSVFQPTSQYTPAITNTSGQVDSTYWTDINSMTTDQIAGDGQVYYAVSTDGRTTWSVIDDTNGVRPIVRDNAGTWEYNSNATYGSTTWTSATTNAELDAIQEALSQEAQNRMDKTQLEAVTDANHYTLSDELDLMIALYLGSESSSIPSSDGVSINYDANVKNEGAVLGTDYDYDFPANDVVRITSNATQNLKVRVV